MILAIELTRDGDRLTPFDPALRIGLRAYRAALERASSEPGVVLRPLGDILYWMPPYCIDEAQLQLLARLIEQTGDVLGTKKIEFGTANQQCHEVLGGQLVAENIINRRVAVGRWPAGSDSANREALPGPEAEDGVFGDGDFAGLARLYLAGFDQVKVTNVARIRADDQAAGGVESDLCLLGKTLQGIRLHLVKWGVIFQESERVSSDTLAAILAE